MRVLLAVIVVAAVQVCATRRRPPFTLNNLVACGKDADDGKPSVVPTIPIVPTDLDKFWLPRRINVDPPRGNVDYKMLEDEYVKRYGMSFNSSLSAVVVPPGEDGVISYKLSRTIKRPALVRGPNANDPNFFNSSIIFANLNGLGICDSEIVFEWVQLPEYYFPGYVLTGRCTSTTPSCAFPPDTGKRCAPDAEDTQLVDVLSWDCCYALVDKWWIRRCGWRHVRVPTIIHCACKCSGVNPDSINFA